MRLSSSLSVLLLTIILFSMFIFSIGLALISIKRMRYFGGIMILIGSFISEIMIIALFYTNYLT